MHTITSVTQRLLERRVIVETMGMPLEFTFPLFYTDNCKGNLVSLTLAALQRKSSFQRPVRLAASPYHYFIGRDVDYIKSAQHGFAVMKPFSPIHTDSGTRTLLCFDPEPGRELEALIVLYRLWYGQEFRCIEIPPEANDPLWAINLPRLFHPTGATLASCAREFRQFNSQYQDYRSARGACGAVTNSFLSLLTRRGVLTLHSEPITMKFCSLRGYSLGGLRFFSLDHAAPWGCHCYIVGSYGEAKEGFVLDWTYRQFDDQSVFPFIRRFRGTPIHEGWWQWSMANPAEARAKSEYPAPCYDDD